MKRMCLAALTGALAISSMAVAIDDASAQTRGVYRGGVNRVGVDGVGVGRVGIGYGRAGIGYGRAGIGYGRAGIGYGRAGLAYRGGYYRRGLGVAVGAAAVAGAGAYYGGYYGDGGYGAYASAGYDTTGEDTYILHGNYMSGSDAVAYCARNFRSYDIESQTFMSYSGQRVSCPQ